MMDSSAGLSDRPSPVFMDPLRVISNLARQSGPGVSSILAILPVIIKSGVNIPSAFYKNILDFIVPSSPEFLGNAKAFARCVTLSLWLRSLGRQDLQALIASLHMKVLTRLSECLSTGHDAADA